MTDRMPLSFPRLFLGLLVVVLGSVLLLDQLEILDSDEVFRFWGVLPVAIGLFLALRPEASSQRWLGAVLVLVGGWSLLHAVSWVNRDFWDFWPLLLILVGAGIVWNAVSGGNRAAQEGDASESFNTFALMSGIVKRMTSGNFRGGEATAVMGGCELDLSDATMQEGKAVVDVLAVMGGVELRVPATWGVTNQVKVLMGGIEDKTRCDGEPEKTLIVRGLAIMGGVEIKN